MCDLRGYDRILHNWSSDRVIRLVRFLDWILLGSCQAEIVYLSCPHVWIQGATMTFPSTTLYRRMWESLEKMDEGKNPEKYLMDQFLYQLHYSSYERLISMVRAVVEKFYANYF